jgi:hypothetical protein
MYNRIYKLLLEMSDEEITPETPKKVVKKKAGKKKVVKKKVAKKKVGKNAYQTDDEDEHQTDDIEDEPTTMSPRSFARFFGTQR